MVGAHERAFFADRRGASCGSCPSRCDLRHLRGEFPPAAEVATGTFHPSHVACLGVKITFLGIAATLWCSVAVETPPSWRQPRAAGHALRRPAGIGLALSKENRSQ